MILQRTSSNKSYTPRIWACYRSKFDECKCGVRGLSTERPFGCRSTCLRQGRCIFLRFCQFTHDNRERKTKTRLQCAGKQFFFQGSHFLRQQPFTASIGQASEEPKQV